MLRSSDEVPGAIEPEDLYIHPQEDFITKEMLLTSCLLSLPLCPGYFSL